MVQAFLDRGYNVVATSRGVSKANFAPSPHLALVDGDIGQAATADNVAQTAIGKFGSINHIVNNAGIFAAKSSTAYSIDEFRRFVSTNLEGFIFITQLAVKQMLSPQGTGGSVTSITTSFGLNATERGCSRLNCDDHQRGLMQLHAVSRSNTRRTTSGLTRWRPA